LGIISTSAVDCEYEGQNAKAGPIVHDHFRWPVVMGCKLVMHFVPIML